MNTRVENKVIGVSLHGGLIGKLVSSRKKRLNCEIEEANAEGWRVVQVIPSSSSSFFIELWRSILLVITLFLYTTSSGYLVVLERYVEWE